MRKLKLVIFLEFSVAFFAYISGVAVGVVGFFYVTDFMKPILIVTAIENMVVATMLWHNAKEKWEILKYLRDRRGIS